MVFNLQNIYSENQFHFIRFHTKIPFENLIIFLLRTYI